MAKVYITTIVLQSLIMDVIQKTPKGLLPEDKIIYETIALWRAEEGLPTIKERS